MDLNQAVLANDLESARRLIAEGADPSDGLWVTCTPAMLALLLERGADPRGLRSGASVLDAAAQEGRVEMVRLLLRSAPELATEERALMAADHPAAERVIRAVADGGLVDSIVETQAGSLSVTRVGSFEPGAPPKKTSSRFYSACRATMAAPSWAEVDEKDAVFAGPAGGIMAFGERTRWITEEREVVLNVPPLTFPWEHAFDEAGEHFFFGYGQARLLGVDVGGRVIVDEKLPGAGWGKAIARLRGEAEGGHAYPARMCVAGRWLAAVSLERIHFIPFGELAEMPTTWFTCQLGTCAVSLRGGRAVLIGARAGGAIFGIDGDRVERLADVEPTLFDGAPNALHGQLRMALRVSGQGHDDPRSLEAELSEEGTRIIAKGVGGMTSKIAFVPGLQVDPAELDETWPTRPEPTDAWETADDEVRVHVQPIGRDDVRAYRLDGLDALLDAAFATIEVGEVDGLAVLDAPIPRTYSAPHKSMGTLSYPEVGPTGYAFGHKVSRRPGKWNSYVVDSEGVHAFEPHWFSGVTYGGFHPTEPRLVAGTAREVIEVDLTTRKWSNRSFDAAIRGVAYFDGGLAVHAGEEVLLLDGLDAEPRRKLRAVVTRNANLVSFHGGQVLWVPLADRSVLLAARGSELVILGVLRIGATGKHETPDGDYLSLMKGAARLVGLAQGIASADVLESKDLMALEGPELTPHQR